MAKPIDKRAKFDLVRYANCWEDADVLCQAIQPASGKRILSIASGGDNSFSLLAYGSEVVAADLSPAQLACVELKKAAFELLDYREMLSFLGVTKCADRIATYRGLADRLSTAAQKFWRANDSAVRNGFIHSGKFEGYFHKFRTKVLPLVHSRAKVEQLLAKKDREERLEFFRRRWNTWRWRWMFKIFFSRFVMGRMGRDPEFFRYVEGSVADRILERTQYAITQLSTHDNPYLTYILTGNFGNALPHYLRRENFPAIRAGLPRLTLFAGSVQEAATQLGGQAGFDGFNLSDIFEYLDEPLCRQIFESLLAAARPGARFVYWNMLVPRHCPESLTRQVANRAELAENLFLQDKAWFYSRLVIEEKNGNSADAPG